MSTAAIILDDMGKRYKLGPRPTVDASFREAVAAALTYPVRRLRALRGSNRNGDDLFWALKHISFEVQPGEVVGIIGRNGAGKSTLLKILSRITEPTTGRCEIRGRVGSLLEVGTGFHPELTGRENIYLNGAILGMRKAEIDRKFDQMVAFAEVGRFLDTPVKRYSSGMYVRLAFAVAAHLDPEILLVDEVLSVGDAGFQKKCLGKMDDVAKAGRTVLFVSHNLAAVDQLCTRAVLLADGQVTETGTVSQVIQSYLSQAQPTREDPTGPLAENANATVQLLAIGPVDDAGRPLSAVQSGRQLNLRIVVRSTVPLPQATLALGINTLHDFRVSTLDTRNAGHYFDLGPGTHTVICRVPDFPLTVGRYVLDVKVYAGSKVLLWAPHIERFSVEAGNFFKSGNLPDPSWAGLCYLPQQWETPGDQARLCEGAIHESVVG